MLYLHIGSYKTGSSAIQSYLQQQRGALKNSGICVLRPPAKRNAYATSKDLAKADLENETVTVMRRQYRKHDGNDSVYSNEYLFNPNVAQGLKKIFDPKDEGNIRIVCYLRRPDAYVEALYKQMVKNGRIDPDPEIVLKKFRQEKAPYQQTLDNFADTFGDKNIIVRVYECDKLIDGDAVADFLNICGFPSVQPGTEIRNNPSLSAAMSEAIGRVARLLPVNHQLLLRDIVRESSPGNFRSGDVFDLNESRAVFTAFEDEIRAISNRFLGGVWPIFNMEQLDDGAKDRFPSAKEVIAQTRSANEDVLKALGKLLGNDGGTDSNNHNE